MRGSLRLEPDALRTGTAALLVLLVLGGWLLVAFRPEMRGALAAQPGGWWAAQLLLIAHAVSCVGVVRRSRIAWWPALVLTVACLLYLGSIVGLSLANGRLPLNLTFVLVAILFWRLLATAPSSSERAAG